MHKINNVKNHESKENVLLDYESTVEIEPLWLVAYPIEVHDKTYVILQANWAEDDRNDRNVC
jgi:hypothetical protein